MEIIHHIGQNNPRAALELAQEILNGFEVASADGDANTMARQLAEYPLSNPGNLSLFYGWIAEK
jgi:plasmid stabilization system protein ParE